MTPLQIAREALEPFASAIDDLSGNEKDSWSIWESPVSIDLTVGHLRAASQALAAIDAAQPDDGGVIVTDSSFKRFRTWKDGFSAWTDNRNEATRYHRRTDAEAVHAEDEDAWHIVTYATGEDAPDDTQTAAETRGWNAAIEAAAQLVDLAKERTLGLAIRTLAKPEGGA